MFNWKNILVYLTTFLALQSAIAVRMDEDQGPSPAAAARQVLLEQKLLDSLKSQNLLLSINGNRVVMDLQRSHPPESAGRSLDARLLAAMDLQLQELSERFSDPIKAALREKWLHFRQGSASESWLKVGGSTSSQGILLGDALGATRIYGVNGFEIILDSRMESLPLLRSLSVLLNLTHVIGPQLMIMQGEGGSALYREGYGALHGLTEMAAYRSFFHWLSLAQMQKALSSEVRSSTLQLLSIRSLLAEISENAKNEPIASLRKFIETRHPRLRLERHLKDFVQEWLYSASAASSLVDRVAEPKAPREAKILEFRPRQPKTCVSTLSE